MEVKPLQTDSKPALRWSSPGGLFVRKERWGLSWRGRLLVTGVLLVVGAAIAVKIHPFLSPTERVTASLMVVEGWSPPITMKQAAAEFMTGHYEQMVLIRPVLDVSDNYESGRYSADWVARLLVQNGVPDDKLTTLCPNVARKDRTYHSALAVRQWIAEQHLAVGALVVATEGPHARRSRLLYQKAFGDSFKIGIIAMQPPTYDPKHWWRTSEGVREVLGETIAYLYARFFFFPAAAVQPGLSCIFGQSTDFLASYSAEQFEYFGRPFCPHVGPSCLHSLLLAC